MTPPLTVIIPTMATRERRSVLLRAIDAIRNQDITCHITVVANGPRRDPDVIADLGRLDDVELLMLDEGNLVKALAAGVNAVRTNYFSVLDDDDILMPSACSRRVRYMEAHPDADALITPGQKQFADERTEWMPARFNAHDPLASLFDYNWLTPCGGIYRRSHVGPEYFASMPRYLEWTYLAFRLIRERNVHFCLNDSEPHFTMFETVGSESQKLEYFMTMPDNLLRMEDPSLSGNIQRLLADKVVRALHEASTRCLEGGQLGDAWRFHVKCLGRGRGIRFLPYTRHLLFATFRPPRRAPAA